MNTRKTKLAIALSALLLSTQASAVSVIGPEVAAQFVDTNADMVAVGALIIPLAAVAMGIKWVKATFF